MAYPPFFSFAGLRPEGFNRDGLANLPGISGFPDSCRDQEGAIVSGGK